MVAEFEGPTKPYRHYKMDFSTTTFTEFISFVKEDKEDFGRFRLIAIKVFVEGQDEGFTLSFAIPFRPRYMHIFTPG